MDVGCEVVMPRMGESIEEGEITRWLVNVGDYVERDQPLFEISTDKVDAEIPSPASGVLRQILYPVGTTVPVDTVVARIGPDMVGVTAPDGASPAESPPLLPGESPAVIHPRPSAPARNRALWGLVTAWFVARLLWHLYSFMQGEEDARQSLLPAAGLLFGTAHLLEEAKRGLLYKLLLIASVALVLAFLILSVLTPR